MYYIGVVLYLFMDLFVGYGFYNCVLNLFLVEF